MEDQTIPTTTYITEIKSITDKKNKFDLNDIVALKSHPYQAEYFEPKIGAYARFTPPLMIVIEILNKTTHDTSTGVRDSNQYKCLFYSSKEGKFEKLWFKGDELKYIGTYEKENYKIESFNINEWKTKLIGKDVVLQTVDLELGKKKTFLDTVDNRSKMKVSNLLDYLPPVASILDVKYEDDHTKYNEKNGKVKSIKFDFHVKIKWLNNESGKFSEDTLPLGCLRLVSFNEDTVFYKRKKTYMFLLQDKKRLEDNEFLYFKAIPLYLASVTFNHYHYVYDTINLFTKKRKTLQREFPVNSYIDLEGLLNAGNDLGDRSKIQEHFVEEKDIKNKWYSIRYIDRNGLRTERIVYVQDLLPKLDALPDEEIKPTLKCNCLLRGGLVRNFVVQRIEGCVQLPEEFETIFFERINAK